jgi:2-polyprenyl-3-methyl-5-hydroxy-6-metoxy-1,4-benzoquinol methylase
VKKEIMFGDHTYLSGITRSLNEHFRQLALEVDSRFFQRQQHKSVLDIGSNDGTQLKHFKELGYDIMGVESSKSTARMANDAGIFTLNKFFDLTTARELGKKFDVINAAGVFFHLEDLHSVTDGIREALQDNGVFVVQFLYMKSIVENLAFDQIYHEHLLYYNLETLEALLKQHGLSTFDAYLAPIHGGSMIAFITHKDTQAPTQRLLNMRQKEVVEKSNDFEIYQKFSRRICRMKEENLFYLAEAKGAGKRIWGFGAPVKGNTMLNYFGAGTQYIDCLVEKNELRRGLYSPGMHIPVVIEMDLKEHPDIYYVLAWNFKKEILANNQELVRKGVEFHFPVDPKEPCA